MTEEIGPVRFCLGSHRDGLVRVHTKDPANPAKTGAYGLMLENRDQRVAAYRQIAPLLQPGDLIVVDFLTLHASGTNRSTRSRWSMQFRYFNFHDPTGIRIGWRGSYAAGVDFATIHPELIAE
jgi:ectoine hydroxylase-related dioxygenase (phytanoyl-CoA dioxygenase family)